MLDVSAAFSIVIGSSKSEQFSTILESAEKVIAPDLFYSEATNTAWKFHHIEDASEKESMKLAERAIQLIDLFIQSDLLWKTALHLACELDHSTYDCYYLALAQNEKATLLTTDKRLLRIANRLEIPH